jgi:hypothetical protein
MSELDKRFPNKVLRYLVRVIILETFTRWAVLVLPFIALIAILFYKFILTDFGVVVGVVGVVIYAIFDELVIEKWCDKLKD